MTDAPPPLPEDDDGAPVDQPATSPVGIPRIGVTPVKAAEPAPAPVPQSRTLLVDAAPKRLRRTEDLMSLVLTVLGILSMLILAVYAHSTTSGVTQDVQNALAVVLRRILVFPLQALEVIATFVIPVVVLIARIARRQWHVAASAGLAMALGYAAGLAAFLSVSAWAPSALITGLTVTASGEAIIGISATFAALGGLVTGAGERTSSPLVRYSWTALWVVAGLAVLRSALTLPGAVLSILLGRAAGLLVRYALGVDDERAHGIALIRALRRAGVDAVRVVRMDSAPEAAAWTVRTDAPVGYTERVREKSAPTALAAEDLPGAGEDLPDEVPEPEMPRIEAHKADPGNTIEPAEDVDLEGILAEASSHALSEGRPSVHRIYAAWDEDGLRRDVTVLDADRQVAGFLSTLWDRIRIKGLSPTRDLSVRPAAEHAALMSLEARRAGVRTPELVGMAEADESVLLVTEHVIGARPLVDAVRSEGAEDEGAGSGAEGDGAGTAGTAGTAGATPSARRGRHAADVTDTVLADLWGQIRRAHAAGLAHREISGATVVVDAADHVWLLDWDSGEVVSSELSRRVDLAQTLALLAAAVGVDRAIESASRSLSTEQLASIAPMLQRVVLPSSTRDLLGRRGKVLQQLRDALVALTPTAHAEPAKLTRFSPRTVIMAVIGLVALWVLLAQLNFEKMSAALEQANPWWILGALVFSLATYMGAGISLVAFSPVRLNLFKSTEVHLASSVVALVAPAGVGGAAINLRFLNRKGVPTAVGVATVALVQVVQFLVTVVLLVVLAAITGQSTGLSLPSGWIIVIAAVIVAIVAVALAVPRVRTWVWEKVEPTYRQVWPRLVWVVSNPTRLLAGISGNIILSLSYIMAFAASLWALGYHLSFSVLAITYLASNTVGSIIPSPGGIGPVEIALTGGLAAAGVPYAIAFSTAMVYRLVTFWIPIPIGWLSLQRLQKHGDL